MPSCCLFCIPVAFLFLSKRLSACRGCTPEDMVWGAESVRGMSAGESERWRGAVSSAWSLLGDIEAHGVWVIFPKPATPRLPALSLQ